MTDLASKGKARDKSMKESMEAGLASLDDRQLEELRKAYGLRAALLAADGEIIASMPAAEMESPASLAPFVEAYRSMLKAPDNDVAGSYFASSLSALALGQQRLASHHGVAADLSLHNVTVYLLRDGDGYPRVVFALADPRLEQEPSLKREPAEPLIDNAEPTVGRADREAWMRAVLERLHGETLRPILEWWSVATGLRPGYLWGTMPTRFNHNIELQESEANGDDALLSRIRQGYRQLKELDKSLFGLPRNPFDVKIRWIEHIGDACGQMRMKNVCCLYYKTDGGSYCYTCPKSSEEERARRRLEHRAAQSG